VPRNLSVAEEALAVECRTRSSRQRQRRRGERADPAPASKRDLAAHTGMSEGRIKHVATLHLSGEDEELARMARVTVSKNNCDPPMRRDGDPVVQQVAVIKTNTDIGKGIGERVIVAIERARQQRTVEAIGQDLLRGRASAGMGHPALVFHGHRKLGPELGARRRRGDEQVPASGHGRGVVADHAPEAGDVH